MSRRDGSLLLIPPIAAAILFGWALGHRSDYLGHYAAGFGATLMALMLIPPAFGPWVHAGAAFMCILMGAGIEATVFRIAKFDEIDFCNQSLGAVFAALAAFHVNPSIKDRTAGAVLGFLYLVAGFYFAFR